MTEPAVGIDPFDVRRARRAPGLLREFNDAGVLAAADVHVALRLAGLAGEHDETVILAAALAVRAPRLAHVHLDLATIRDTATVDADEPLDLSTLPWPSADAWIERVGASALVAVGEPPQEDAPSEPWDEEDGKHRRPMGEEDGEDSHPLRLLGRWLYLDRYWREERLLAADLGALSAKRTRDVRIELLADGLARLFAGETESRQCLAAASAILRRLGVLAGGPGTGKTTILARIVALLAEQAEAAGAPAPLVALAAPTGKAAARLGAAVHHEAGELDVGDAIRAQLLSLQASTLHRLLGWRPDSHSRFRHHRGQRLPHDLVIVDETSMVSLSLMARLVEAIRPDARLILVGDPGQLASIEAGAVLGDIVGPAGVGLRIGSAARVRLAEATGQEIRAQDPPSGATVAEGIVVLDRIHRFGGAIARLADAIRRGDADTVLELLANARAGEAPAEARASEAPGEARQGEAPAGAREGEALADVREGVVWIPVDVADPAAQHALIPVRDRAVAAGRVLTDAARTGAGRRALAALGAFRILCAHRRGPQGVASWTARIESWLTGELAGFTAEGRWYVGRPLLVTENDYELGLYNGDTGVVVQSGGGRVSVAFERHDEIVALSPTRLGAVDTVYAMTIHKSQGSQFDTAAVLLPAPTSRILTRELLYTAATRARKLLILAGTEASIRAALDRPVARASGLRWRLWGDEGREPRELTQSCPD